MVIYGTNSKSSSRRSRNGTITPNLCLGFIVSRFVGFTIAAVLNLTSGSLGFAVVAVWEIICMGTIGVVRCFDPAVELKITFIFLDPTSLENKNHISYNHLICKL